MTKHVMHIKADSREDLAEALSVALATALGLVPPAGIEPALPEEPDFESGASTNSAKGACACNATEPAPQSTFRQWTCWEVLAGYFSGATQGLFIQADRLGALENKLDLPHDWTPLFSYDERGYWYLQIAETEGTDNVTGEPMSWRGRKWLISEHMTDGEIVQTVFKAVMTAMEHEAREQFKYRGQPILDPHYDIEKLVALRSRTDALGERKAA